MKTFAAFALATSVLAAPAVATGPADIAAPTAQDEAQIDMLVDPVLAGLKSGQPRSAIKAFFATSPLIQGKTGEIENFTLQVEGTQSLYGVVHDCQLVEKQTRGQWAESRLYICQHEKFLTRWTFDAMKTSLGWKASNLHFDDKFSLGLGQ